MVTQLTVLDRIVLSINAIITTVISCLGLAAALGWGWPHRELGQALHQPGGRWAVGALGVVLLLASLRLLFTQLASGDGKPVVYDTKMGQVEVSTTAISNLVRRIALQTAGVRDVKPKIHSNDAGVQVSLRLWVSPDVSIPDLSREIEDKLGRYVERVVGSQVTAVTISVANITTESRASKVD